MGGLTRLPAGLVVFEAEDASHHANLWVSDGSAAGTSKLTVSGANPALGLTPTDLTLFQGRVLLTGLASSGQDNLWVSDGTVAGTSELMVANGSLGLFQPATLDPDFTVFGGKALFAGIDAAGNPNLWVTDGTGSGTAELSVSGASSAGLFGPLPTSPNFFNPDFTVLGGTVLFDGTDASGHKGLWVTDGTGPGTSEISVAGASASGLFSSIANRLGPASFGPDFTVFGSNAIFVGADSKGNSGGVWLTDGTAAGTSEIATSANPNTPEFTVLGGKVLFTGSGDLWVTDGTAAGTSDILSEPFNGVGGLLPTDLTVFGTRCSSQATTPAGSTAFG